MKHDPQRIAILTYHSLDESGSVLSISPQTFAEHMTCLSDLGFRGMSLRDAVSFRERNGAWPDRAAVLTFDDGFESVLEHAVGTLKRHGHGATLFLVSGHVGRWNDWETPPAGFGRRKLLSWAGVRDVASAGIEIGAHTRTHPDLSRLTLRDAEAEMTASQAEIQDSIQQRVESFAYPYGSTTAGLRRAAATAFRACCTTRLSRSGLGDSLDALPRVDSYYLQSMTRFSHCMNGTLDRYLAIRRCGRAARTFVSRDTRPIHMTGMRGRAAGSSRSGHTGDF